MMVACVHVCLFVCMRVCVCVCVFLIIKEIPEVCFFPLIRMDNKMDFCQSS